VETCKIEWCDKPKFGHGLCQNHAYRLRVHGDPLGGRASSVEIDAAFEAVFHYVTDCVLWQYQLTPSGYGIYRSQRVNRAVCERLYGPCPPGMEAAHECGVRACFNPRHLHWKTPLENGKDKIKHGTSGRGEKNPQAKLTAMQVLEIRERREAGESLSDLGLDYGVSLQNIHLIASRKKWTWL
jgi:hypothetical protein